ncbi:MAG TPA: VOC family protein [Pyrinomonadaceae bacterium]|jgi:hypothetical protein|nr:VOC family protein [Pyrinomonadaceae bacterium]
MPKRYDVYGFRTLSIEEALEWLQATLGVEFNRRDSEYRGLYYRTGSSQLRGLMLYANQTPDGRRNSQHKDYGVILTASALEDMDDIQRKLTEGRTEPTLLSTKVFPDDPPDDELDEDNVS